MPQGQKIVSKSDLLVLHRPQHSRRPLIYVRVTVERGTLTVQKCSRRCAVRPSSVNGEYDLKVVWVTNNCDVLDGNVRFSFEVLTPERCYIFQADSHRAKIDWMQALCIGCSQCLQFRGSYRPASWSNLEDLQLWLSVREVQYEYREVESYMGATYTGKWNMAKPEGMGSMQWPDGHRYDGEFVKGKIEGTGTMLWLSDERRSTYTGSWKNGREEGHGEMTYRDGSVYRGWWRNGIRHGHGRMEFREPDSLYFGGWENDIREGYGVLHSTVSGEHYLGMWQSDRFHGPAVLISRGVKQGESVFHCGVFRQGEKIEGSLSVEQLQHSSKWAGLFQKCADLLEEMVTSSHSNPEVCHRAAASDEGQEPAVRGGGGGGEDEMRDIYRAYGAVAGNSRKECSVCSMEGFNSADHPFGMLVNHLTRCFNESYSTIAEHPDLLPHAIGELTSISLRLHQLISKLCPTVVQSSRTLLQSRRTESRRQSPSSLPSPSGMGVAGSPDDHTWLYPILLPSITETLMTLYRAHCAVEDKRLSATLRDLDEKSDGDLCELLELMSEYQCWRGKQELDTFSDLLRTATETFSKLRECRSPLNKLLCVQETNSELTKVYKRLHSKRDSFLAYPPDEQGQLISSKLLSFAIVRSQQNLDCLKSEISFISDFAGSVLHTEEYGYLLTELKSCYQQLSELYVDEEEWI